MSALRDCANAIVEASNMAANNNVFFIINDVYLFVIKVDFLSIYFLILAVLLPIFTT